MSTSLLKKSGAEGSVIFDTDVIVWALRGKKEASDIINAEGERSFSVISYMELLQGGRNRAEIRVIKSFLSDGRFEMLPLSGEIGRLASHVFEEHCLSGGISVADALIAATAIVRGQMLCTGNVKHYRRVHGLDLFPFRHEDSPS